MSTGADGDFLGEWFYLRQLSLVSSMPASEARNYTQNAVTMPGCVWGQLEEMCCHCTSDWSGPGLSEGSLTTEMSEFVTLHLNSLFFFFLLLVSQHKGTQNKSSQETRLQHLLCL